MLNFTKTVSCSVIGTAQQIGTKLMHRLRSCEYVSTIPEKKTACYRPLKNRHFVMVCTEKMMDYQYSPRNIYSNYNQI